MGVQAHPLETGRREVRTVIAVENIRQPSNRPGRVRLAVNGLMHSESSLLRRRGTNKEGVAGDGAGAIVEDDRQPRPHRGAGLVEHGDVQESVVGLPLLVGAGSGSAEHQLEAVSVGGVPVLGEGPKAGIDAREDVPDARVARRGEVPVAGVADTSVDERRGGFRPSQRQCFDRFDQLSR